MKKWGYFIEAKQLVGTVICIYNQIEKSPVKKPYYIYTYKQNCYVIRWNRLVATAKMGKGGSKTWKKLQ